jgi:hypothetical protein
LGQLWWLCNYLASQLKTAFGIETNMAEVVGYTAKLHTIIDTPTTANIPSIIYFEVSNQTQKDTRKFHALYGEYNDATKSLIPKDWKKVSKIKCIDKHLDTKDFRLAQSLGCRKKNW